MKNATGLYWTTDGAWSMNTSGFNALPGGEWNEFNSAYNLLDMDVIYWTGTEWLFNNSNYMLITSGR